MTFEQEVKSSSKLIYALQELHMRIGRSEARWLLGGSCGLWLQGVGLATGPRDVDVYADYRDARILHGLLKDLAVDEPRLDESGIYSSELSHYSLGEYSLELVGGFRIETDSSSYTTEVTEVLAPEAQQIALEGASLPLMPLAHELLFNLLRSRQDRYQAIAEVITTEPTRHVPLLKLLIARNRWSREHQRLLEELLSMKLQ